ncbi:uncharacterized protein PAC_04033 [Phialocephala subalpina]|uniref:Uncharacterized protein n=1 Tax=Phialocephala subalpina TaxID=576137 RepID=A0A1L7WN02_9HELO|nr:uncharacterized protein PAC_04033 [Phialocephala subalpina]
MAGHSTQNRDRGYRHSNPKPHPHKKAPRVPGEGRFRKPDESGYWNPWFAWNRRRELKFPKYDRNPIIVAKEYENMSANMYRHNLEAKKTFDSGIGWTRTGPKLASPEDHRADMAGKRGLIRGTKRKMLGSERVGRMKRPGRWGRKMGKREEVEVTGSRCTGKNETDKAGAQTGEENQEQAHNPPAFEGDSSHPCDSKSEELEESEDRQTIQEVSEWIEVKSEIGLESPDTGLSVAMDDEYVVI